MRRHRLMPAAVAFTGLWWFVGAGRASAHPLGNFTVNHYAGIRVGADGVGVDYVVDEAEIPTFQDRQAIGRTGEQRWADERCAREGAGLRVAIDGRALDVKPAGAHVLYNAGAGGLPTLRLECSLTASHRVAGTVTVTVHDGNDTGRIGWREITVAGNGAVVERSDVPAASTSQQLTKYPTELLNSPLDVRTANALVRVDIATAAAAPAGATGAAAPSTAVGRKLPLGASQADRLTALVTRNDRGAVFYGLAIAVALFLGALHAFAPGHGKTVMAAYLVGERGGSRDAALIAGTVTLTHTAGVLLLGVVLAASDTAASDRLYPWLTLVSGLLFLAIGGNLILRYRRRRRHDHDHSHGHSHGDSHGDSHHHHHHHPHTDEHGEDRVRWTSLVSLGIAGGIVPTPSALVVLVGAIAIGRVAFGVVLVTCYGAGMAIALTALGLVLARARKAVTGGESRWSWRLAQRVAGSKLLPLGAAAIVTVVGGTIAARGLAGLVG